MPMARAYEVDSGLVPIAGTSLTPALYFATTATNDCNVVRIKCSVEAVSAPAPPSNGSIFFSLNKVTGGVGGGATVTPTQLSGATLAANTAFKSGSTALTGLTHGVEYWPGPAPLTAGAWVEDAFENTGLEINIPASGLFAVYFIAPSGAGSGLSARVALWFTE
jgi:hypothetical protein